MTAGQSRPRVTVTKDGPTIVTGAIPMALQTIAANGQGGSERWEQGVAYPVQETYALCRYGQSENAPFCDGSHIAARFCA